MPTSEKAYLNDINNDSLHILLKDFSSLNRAVELKTVLQKSIEIIQNVMQAEAGSLMLRDDKTGELVVSMPRGPVEKEIQGKRISKGSGVGGWVIKNGKPFYSNNPQESDIFAGDLSPNFTTNSIICVPLSNKKGELFGVLQAINRVKKDGFGDQDIPVFQALADQVAIAIERTKESERLQKELQEKELMLTEVHHRIKNNLSTLSALIEMEFSEVKDEVAKQVLRKTSSRIGSMTEIHDLLNNSTIQKEIDLGSYLERLTQKVSSVLTNPSQNVIVEVEAESITLENDRVLSCGLLLNELLVNAYKHAFASDVEDGKIHVQLIEQNDGVIILHVSDNGEGLDKNFSFRDGDSIGSWLIDVLLRRLNASIEISGTAGAGFLVRFEK